MLRGKKQKPIHMKEKEQYENINQSTNKMNFDLLNPLSPEVISRQATINVGTIGHVAHGKSTLVKSLSGVNTGKFGKEKERNMTIKLGYANAKIFECDNAECPRPGRYRSGPSNKAEGFSCDRRGCGGKFRLIRHISFVDCPGHETYMAAMLNGAAVMDAAILVIAANEACPKAQTAEHLAAVEIMKLNSLMILQSKIDLVGRVRAEDSRQQIERFVQGTCAENAAIIPISAQFNGNMDAVCDYLVRHIPVPIRDFSAIPRMTIIRSFDVNKPGTEINDLKGGIVGGSISQGIFRVDQEIEIRPGLVYKDKDGALQCRPIRSRIVSLYAEQNQLTFAVPGGLTAVGTNIDPSLCRADGLVGQILGACDTLPKVYLTITIKYNLLRHLIGEQIRLSKITKDEILLLNIGSLASHGRVLAVRGDQAKIQLSKPVCAEISDKLALSRRIQGHFRLIGWGQICAGKELDLPSLT